MIHASGAIICHGRPDQIPRDQVYLVFGFENGDYICNDRNGDRVDIPERAGDAMQEAARVRIQLSTGRLSRDPGRVRRLPDAARGR